MILIIKLSSIDISGKTINITILYYISMFKFYQSNVCSGGDGDGDGDHGGGAKSNYEVLLYMYLSLSAFSAIWVTLSKKLCL